jgi:Zn-dependent protease with chaperone function
LNAARENDLLAGLEGELSRAPLPTAYGLGLVLVSAAMVMLPLLYLALVAASAWAVYWWAVHGWSFLFAGRLYAAKAQLFFYVVPLVCGGAVPLFLVKPLFARRPPPPPDIPLDRREQPLLFAFVERLAALVGAPAPDRIVVDCRVNAGAGLDLGLLRHEGSALVMTIGLPLVAGMTVPQLASVLAHEFGHFRQGLGMRLCRLIREVNAWFHRVVYERDSWDDALEDGRQGEGWESIVSLGAQTMVGLGRKVLFGLMVAGHGISCFLSRQMEFDADQYEARVGGSAVFADTSLRIRVLTSAAQYVMASALRDDRLVDDVPALIASVAEQVPARLMAEIKMDIQRSGTGLFDTHPSDLERIRRARAGRFPGVLKHRGPASALFADFPAVCRRATRELYEEALGPHAPLHEALLPVAAFVAGPTESSSAEAFAFPANRPPRLAAHLAIVAADGVALDAARVRWKAAAAAAAPAAERFARACAQELDASKAEPFLAAGLALRATDFSLPAATLDGVQRTRTRSGAIKAEAEPALSAAERALGERIGLGIGALADPPVVEEARRLSGALPALERAQAAAEVLRHQAPVLDCLLTNQRGAGLAGLDTEILQRQRVLAEALDATRSAFDSVPLPGLVWDVPPSWRDDPASFVRAAERAVQTVDEHHARTIERLVEMGRGRSRDGAG